MGKRIALCMDGTWDGKDDEYQSNIAALSEAIRQPTATDGNVQGVQYQKGVGATSFWPQRLTDGIIGASLPFDLKQ